MFHNLPLLTECNSTDTFYKLIKVKVRRAKTILVQEHQKINGPMLHLYMSLKLEQQQRA